MPRRLAFFSEFNRGPENLPAVFEDIGLHVNRLALNAFDRMQAAVGLLRDKLDGIDYCMHKPEGAIFLWLWFKNLPIPSARLYQRLKQRGVLVISGHYFFPGLEHDDWPHKHQCIRMTYSQKEPVVQKGIEIIADEIKAIYAGA